MTRSNNSAISRPLTIVAGFDHVTGLVSDGNGRFPGRCDTFSVKRSLSQNQLSSEEVSAVVHGLESDLRERFADVYLFSEFAVSSCFQSIFEVTDDHCRQNANDVSALADVIWNHYYDHAVHVGMEQFHVSLVAPSSDESSVSFKNSKPGFIPLTSFATTRDTVSGILTAANRVGLRVKQLQNISTAKATTGGFPTNADYLCLDIGWRMSELTQISAGRVCHIASIPLGLFHFTNDVAIIQNMPIEDALRLVRQFGFRFRHNSRPSDPVSDEAQGLKQVRIALESRVQEFTRLLSAKLRRYVDSLNNTMLIPLYFSGQRIPGLWELLSLVFGTACKTAPGALLDFVPKYSETSNNKSLSSAAISEISSVLNYVNLTIDAEAHAYEMLQRFRKMSFASSKSGTSWLRELL
jgi:hypothetical protein